MKPVREFLASYWTPAGRQALGNLIGLGLGTGLSHVCAFGALILLTRSLGPEAFGRVSFALAVMSYLLLIGGLGAGSILIREVARHPDDTVRITASFLTLVSLGSTVVSILHLAVVAGVPLSSEERGLHIALALGTGPLAYALNPLFDAFHRQTYSAAITALCEILALAGLLVGDQLGVLGLPQVGAIYAGKWALMTIGQLGVFHGSVQQIRWGFDGASIRTLLRSGLPVLVSWLVIWIPLTSGILFVRAAQGEASAGEYGIATQFATGVFMIGVIGNRVLQPHINGPYGMDRHFVRKLVAFELGFLLVLSIFGWFAGLLATRWFLPAEYGEVPTTLALLLVAVSAILGAGVVQTYLIRLHREQTMMLLNLGGALTYLAIMIIGVGDAATMAAVVTGGILVASALAAVRYARHSA